MFSSVQRQALERETSVAYLRNEIVQSNAAERPDDCGIGQGRSDCHASQGRGYCSSRTSIRVAINWYLSLSLPRQMT